MKDKLVSIIVTTKNEEKNIENCLKSIIYQTYRNIEIIVVDNASSDRTKEIARKYTNLIFDKGPERSAQRNYGVGVSSGEYVMYIDADMILGPELVYGCIAEMERDESVVGLYISEIILGKSFWSKARRFERSFYDGTVIDAARFIRKNLFLQVGGFDENMSSAEDWDLDRKLSNLGQLKVLGNHDLRVTCEYSDIPEIELKRWEVEFVPFLYRNGVKYNDQYKNALFHNESDFNLLRYLNKKSYYSKDFFIYIGKYGKDDPFIKKQFGMSYRYFNVFLENGKWEKLLIHPILIFGMYLLRFIVGVIYLKNKYINTF